MDRTPSQNETLVTLHAVIREDGSVVLDAAELAALGTSVRPKPKRKPKAKPHAAEPFDPYAIIGSIPVPPGIDLSPAAIDRAIGEAVSREFDVGIGHKRTRSRSRSRG